MKIAILTQETPNLTYKVWVTTLGRIVKDITHMEGAGTSIRYSSSIDFGEPLQGYFVNLGWLEADFNPTSIEWEDLDINDDFNCLPDTNEVPMFFMTFKPLAYDAKMLLKCCGLINA